MSDPFLYECLSSIQCLAKAVGGSVFGSGRKEEVVSLQDMKRERERERERVREREKQWG